MKKILLGTLCAVGLLSAAVDINNAHVEKLMTLNGIGDTKAKAIVEYRKQHCFKKAEDLTAVKGIGEATVEKNKKEITVGKCSTKK
jgi:competence protein ComEA